MKKFVMMMSMVVVIGMFLTGCMQTIEPGNVGLKVSKVGDNRGVSKEALVSGWVFYLPITTKIIEYPVFNQRVVFSADKAEGHPVDESITFQTKDNVPCNMDIAVNYTLREDKVPDFYTKFRADDINLFTHGFMRDQLRSAASQIGSEYDFDSVNGVKKEDFLSKLNTQLSKVVGEYGVVISPNGTSLVGAIRVPENLKAAINARVQSIQDSIRIENELRSTKATAAKKIVEAEAISTTNKLKSASITPQLLEWEKISLEKDRIAKWNGGLPATLITNGTSPLLQIK